MTFFIFGQYKDLFEYITVGDAEDTKKSLNNKYGHQKISGKAWGVLVR